ncbi:MAG: hypothetical protein VX498_12615, partial [Myxococcota bacterium]|nr:hypothetical protein [Myxococcota bacterium]
MHGPTALRVATFVLFSLLANGYVFGVADHGIHLVFVDRLLHREAWAGDLLALAADHHPTVLWWIEAAAGRVLGLPTAFLLLHLLSLAATGLAIDLLVARIGGSTRAAMAALLLLAPAQFALGGVATLDPLLLPRTAALPLELFALVALLDRRRWTAFALLGVAACIHAPSAAGLSVAAVFVLLREPKLSWRKRLLPPLAFFVASAPVLVIWTTGGDLSSSLSPMEPAWLAIVESRLSHHLVPASWPLSEWLWMGAWMVGGHVAFHSSVRLQEAAPFVRGLLAGLILWCLLGGTLLARALDLALALQLEPWECCRFLTLLVGVLIAVRLGEVMVPWRVERVALALGAVAILALFVSRASLGTEGRWLPDGSDGPERELAEWVADNLPPHAVVAWPPHAFHEQRWRSRRRGTPLWRDG